MAELRVEKVRHGEPVQGEAAVLRLERLAVSVGIRRAIENLDLEVAAGDVVWVSGPNGCGKSTLLDAIAGLEPARVVGGVIRLGGEDVTGMPAHERARRGLAYLRQREHVFPDLTVDENLRLALGPDGGPRVRALGSHPAAALPGGKRAGLLSGGERQRLAWAMAVLRPSRLLLADEPEAGLSTALRLPEDRTVILVSHDLSTWQLEAA